MKCALGEFIDRSHSINMHIANHCCTLLGGFELFVQTSYIKIEWKCEIIIIIVIIITTIISV